MTNSPNNRDESRLREERETIWQHASNWLSRTLAVTLVMVLPGILGAYLDKRWGTTLLAPIGFGLGLLLGTIGLVVLAKKLTPPARGQPLPWDEPRETDDPTAEDEKTNDPKQS